MKGKIKLEAIIEALRTEKLLEETDPRLLVNGHKEDRVVRKIAKLLQKGPGTMVVALNKRRFGGLGKLANMGISYFTFSGDGNCVLFASYDPNRTTAASSFIIDSVPENENHDFSPYKRSGDGFLGGNGNGRDEPGHQKAIQGDGRQTDGTQRHAGQSQDLRPRRH
jgi:hypothetical protein